jgi:fermentation-respiration switch protein FrsA (DUF1100 family)
MKLRRIGLACVIGLLVGGALLIVMLRWFEHNQVYHPDRKMDATGAELGRPFENLYVLSSDGVKLNGWFFPADTNSPRAGLAFLVCHGNAGNISHRLELCRALLQTGASVLLFDYRGYGRSQGRPSEEGTYRDAQAAYNWLQHRGFRGDHIIAFGESLGGGVATELAMREELGGLILENTFTSIPDIGAEIFPWLPVRRMASIRYDTCAKLPRIKVPVMLMHSRGDELIGFRHCEKNLAAACEPKLFWELGGGHNEALSDSARFIAGIEKLLEMLRTRQAAPEVARPNAA